MTSDNRRCATCDQLLSRYNTGTICAACQTNSRTIIGTARPHIPPTFWVRSDVRAALGRWDWATVFGAVMTETGASQTLLAQTVGLSQAHVSRVWRPAPTNASTYGRSRKSSTDSARPGRGRLARPLAPGRIVFATNRWRRPTH